VSTLSYLHSVEDFQPHQLDGLPVGWPNPPRPETLLKSLRGMDAVVVAVDESGQVAGYVCGLSDEVLILYVWDLEVRPEHAGQLETELLRRLLDRYADIYQVNAHPAADRQPLFEALGLTPYRPQQAVAMTRMDLARQDGGQRAG
jgi:hypothetical protein